MNLKFLKETPSFVLQDLQSCRLLQDGFEISGDSGESLGKSRKDNG